MRTLCLWFLLSLFAVLSLAGHHGHIGRHLHVGGRRLTPCQRRHQQHHANKTSGLRGKGLFGDGKTSRISDMRGMLFTDNSYRTKTGEWKYSLSTYYLDKPSAAAACQAMGGHLAHITSEDKFNFLTNWLETLSPYDRQQIHIGGHLDSNSAWIPDSGSDPLFLVWHTNEPSAGHGDTWQVSCLLLERRDGKFKMNDIGCSGVRRRFLCEEHSSF